MKGHTIQFVLTRVVIFRDSLYEGICMGFGKIQGGQIYFYYTVKLVIAGFHIIGVPL